MPENKKYIIEIPGMNGADAWDADRWERNAAQFSIDNPDANVFEVDTYNPEDEQEGDQYMISIPGYNGADVWDADRWSRNKEQFMAEHPDAQIKRVRLVNYWEAQAKENRAKREALKGSDEERKAKLAELGYYDDTAEEQDFAIDWRLKPVSSAMKTNSVSGETTITDGKLAEFYANDTEHTEQEAEKARLDAEYDANPWVIEQKEYEQERRNYINSLKHEIDELSKGVDKIAAGKYRAGALNDMPMSPKNYEKGLEAYRKESALVFAKTMLQDAETLRSGLEYRGGKWASTKDAFNRVISSNSTWNSEEYQEGQQMLLQTFQKLQEHFGSLNEWEPEEMEKVLTPEEMQMVNAFFELSAAEAETSGNTSKGFNVGRGIAANLPFMLEFLTYMGVSEAIAGPMAQGLTKAAAKTLARKAGASLVKRAANTATRQLTRAGIGAAKAAVIGATQTLAQGTTQTQVRDAMLSFDDDGYLTDDAKTAAVAYFDKAIENFSEATGDILSGIIGTPLKGGLRALNKAFKTKAFTNIASAITESVPNKILNAAGFHGFFGEMGEEVVGAAIRDLTISDGNLKHFFEKENMLETALTFLPMTVLGGTFSLGQLGYAKASMSSAESRMRSRLADYISKDQLDYIISETQSTTPQHMAETMMPVIQALAQMGAGIKEIEAVRDYMVSAARYQSLMGVQEAKNTAEKEAFKASLEKEVGKFYHAPQVTNKAGETMELSPVVRTVTLKNGKTVYAVSQTNEAGEFLTIDVKTGEQGIAKESDVSEFLNKDGKMQKSSITESLNEFLTRQVMLKHRETEADRMSQQYNEQVAGLQELLKEKQGHINLGTEGAPYEVLVDSTTEQGVKCIAPDGTTIDLTWEQVGDALGQPIKLMTDQQIVDNEIADIARRAAERKAELARRKGTAESAEGAVTEAEKAQAKAEEDAKHIPMNPDGTVNETAFWEQDPEGYTQWNDEQNQDNGADSLRQIAASKQALLGLLSEAQKAAQTSVPADRKAAEREIARLQEKIARMEALEAKYAEEKVAPFRERAMKWKERTKAPVYIIETEDELKKLVKGIDEMTGESRVRGLAKDGKAYIYLPGIVDVAEIDAVFMHEAVAHVGLKGMLGEQMFNELLGEVWEMMSPAVRRVFMSYPGVNADYLAAADEYVAHIAEKMGAGIADAEEQTIWQKIVGLVRKFLRAIGIELKMSEEELSSLLHQAYANLAENMAKAEQMGKSKAKLSVEESAPSAAQQEYAALAEDLTAEEIKAVAMNDYTAAQEAYDALAAEVPKVNAGESAKDFIARKKAYNEQVTAAKAELDARQALLDEIARMENEEMPAEEPEIVEDLEETVQYDGSLRLSMVTYHDWTDNLGHAHKGTRTQVLERMIAMNFSDAEINDMMRRMDAMYEYMDKLRALTNEDGSVRFDEFNAWAEKTPLYKQVGRDFVKAITSLVSNGDYPINMELTTDCIKREAFTMLLNTLIKRGADLSQMGPGEIVTIQKMMNQYGVEVACKLCFVEGKRLQIVNWASQIVEDWNNALIEAGVETDEYFEFGKDGDAFIPAEEWRTHENKAEVAKMWRQLDEIEMLFQGIDPKQFKTQQAKNKKAVAEYRKKEAEKWAKKNKRHASEWVPTEKQEAAMAKMAKEGLAPTYVNENMEEYRNAFNAMRNEWLEQNPGADPLSFTPTQKQWEALGKIRNRQIDTVRAKMVRLIMEYPEMRKKMTLNDLLGSKGLMEIRQQHGQAYADLYSIILQRFGTGTPKPVQDAVPYDGELMTLSEAAFKKANEIGGARLFSFSDFDITKVFDYMQMFFDLEANRQMLQSYTKEVAAVIIFGRSNAKFNISTLANAYVPQEVLDEYAKAKPARQKEMRHQWAENAGLLVDESGNITGINFSEEHSVSPAFAQQIFHDDARNKDCGAIMVGASVNHAIYSAAQAWIRMVIPFHLSGMPKAAQDKTDVKWYFDNTAFQSTRKKSEGKWTKISSSEDTFKFYDDMNQPGWNMRDKTKQYLAWCKEHGYRPKFDWGINSDYYRAYCEEQGYEPNQQIIDIMDADTTDGVWNQYYKFLTDFTAYKPVFNEQGDMIDEIPSPKLPVQSNFDFSEMEREVLFEGEKSMLGHREENIKKAERHMDALAAQVVPFLNGEITEEEMDLQDNVFYKSSTDAENYLETLAENNTRLSAVITPQMDADYLAAVERGDMETAQRMVIEAAKLAMPNTKVVDENGNPKVVYHGTTYGGFTKFTQSPDEYFAHTGFFFADTRTAVEDYTYGEDQDVDHFFPFDKRAEGQLEIVNDWLKTKAKGRNNQGIQVAEENGEWIIVDEKGNPIKDSRGNRKLSGKPSVVMGIIQAYEKHTPEFDGKGVYSTFLNLQNPLVIDAKGESWGSLPMVVDGIKIPSKYDSAQRGVVVTDDWVDYLQSEEGKKLGYDSLIVTDVYDSHTADGTITDYIAFDSAQIKLSAPVTYDDAGNVIPLSERFNPENPDIRFSVRTNEQREQLFDAAKARFGLTNNFKVAGYMLPDGSLLNFGDPANPTTRAEDHRAIEGVIMENGTEYDSRWMYLADFMNEGASRLLPEYAGINLMHAPTKEQRQRLMDFIYKYNGEVILEIADERLNNVAYVEYDRRTSPSRIFRDIDGYFNEGIIPQQDVRFSVMTPHKSSIDELTDLFHMMNQDQALVPLFDKVAARCREFNIEIEFLDKDEYKKQVGRSDDYGSYFRRKIRFNVDTMNPADNQENAATILHEMIHACTNYILSADEWMLTDENLQAREELDAIFKEVKKRYPSEYGASANYELLAELSNPSFRAKLKESNLWDRFVNALRRLFGMESKTDLLARTEDVLDVFLDNPDFFLADIMEPISDEDYLRSMLLDEGQTAIDFLEQAVKEYRSIEESAGGEAGLRYSVRTKPAPEKTQPVYKLMRLGEDGKLYPLFIGNAEAIELGTWYDADSPNLGDLTKLPSGIHLVNNDTGEAITLEQFKSEHPEIEIKGKKPNVAAVNWATANGMRWIEIEDKATAQRRYEGESRSYYNLGINGSGQVGQFAMRPGWHAGSLPSMRQIGKGKDKNLRDDSFVWVRGRVPADVDYQAEADANPDKDIPTHIPTDGFYMKATNANKKASQADKIGWYVAGSFIADEIISDAEARRVIDEWNAGHADAKVEYDYPRESGKDFDPAEGIRLSVVSTDADTSKLTIDEIVESGKQKVLEENAAAADVFIRKLYEINGDLAKLRRAAAAQREYDKNTVQIITRLANELLENGALSDVTRYEIKRILSVINGAVGRNDLTVSVDRLMDIMIGNQLRYGRNRFDGFMKIRGKKVDARGVEVRGRLDIEGQAIMDAMREGISLDIARLEERIAEAEDRLTDASETVRRNAENDLVGYQLAKRYLEEIKESEAEEKDLRKELKDAGEVHKAGQMTDEAYKEFKKSTYDAIRENRMHRVEAYEALLSDMADMIQKSIKNAGQLRDAEKARVENIHHMANSDLQGMPASAHEQKVNKFWNNPIVRLFTAPFATFEQWMKLFGQKSAEGKGYLYNHFIGAWNKANNEEYLGIRDAHAILDAKVKEVFGGELDRWSDLFAIDKKLPKMKISMWDDGAMREFEVTQGNLLYIYMVNKMTDGKMKLRKMGITEEDIDAFVKLMDPRFIQLADWMQDEFLPGLRDKYNAVHERMFGAPMAAIDSYFPIKVNSNARTRDVELGTDTESGRPSSITGSIIKRTKNSLALDVLGSNAFDVLLEHIEQMEHWAAFAEFNRDLNTLLSYRLFRNRVQNMSTAYGSGQEAWSSFKETAEIVAGVYRPKTSGIDKALTNAVRGFTAGKINFRLWTALKQTLSMPAFLAYANPATFAKNIATPWEAWNWAMENLPAFEKRWKSREAGNVRLKKTEADWAIWQSNAMEAMTRWGMTPNAFVDAVTCSIGAKSVYDTMYARYIKDGYSHEKADEKAKLDATTAFNATQQSSESAFLAAVQADRTFVAHMATVFRNNSFGMGRELVSALRQTKDRMKEGFKEESIEFMKKQMMRDGLTAEQATRAAERVYRNSAIKDAARIALFGFGMQFLWNLGGSAVYLLFGDDDEEKRKLVKDAALRGAFGSFESMSFGNLVPEMAASIASGNIKNFHPSLSPAGSDIASLWNEMLKDPVAGTSELVNILVQAGFGVNPQVLANSVVAIVDACDGDMELSKEVGIALLRVLQAPQSNIDKLIMDEIDFTNDKGLDITIDEFAKEYAQYKKLSNASYTWWAYSDENEKKIEDKYIKRFQKTAKELRRTRGTEEAQKYYQYVDEEYKEVGTTLRELKKKVEDAAKQGDNVTALEYAKQIQEFTQTPEFKKYSRMAGYEKAIQKLSKAMKDVSDKATRERLEDKMLELRKTMVEELEKIENTEQ